MVAGTFHVPSATQKPLVFVATAHGVCLLLYCDSLVAGHGSESRATLA